MHDVHTGEAVVTSNRIAFFGLVTTEPVAHSGGCACIRICVGEFGILDAAQPFGDQQSNVKLFA